ncbi:MAG: nucleotidyltransferase family protein [Planctomycetes bacterium]|nr:nucleotidyltransferase family protein [Planctomycetota bacterium]
MSDDRAMELDTALVFAGGRGSRMSVSQGELPKPLVPVLGIPLLALNLLQLRRHGVRHVHFALRHCADDIARFARAHFSSRFDSLTFHVEDEPLGTIGALAWLRDAERCVLTVNADLLSGIDLGSMWVRHRDTGADLTIATHDERHRLRLGEVLIDDDGRVTGYLEKPIKRYRISSGTYLFAPTALRLLDEPRWQPFPALVHRALGAGLRLTTYHHDAPWLDVNDAADLAAAERMLGEDPVGFGLDPRQLHDEVLRLGVAP